MDNAPRLPTTNDPTGYAPYSVTAILAVLLAGFFLLLILVLGLSSLIGGTQLVEPMLLILPAGVLVLSFAARRQIANSEGTRVGLNLCNFAWWIAVIGGFGYTSYLAGRMIGVRQDAKGAIQEWFEVLAKANPLDTRTKEFHRAFQMTLPTGRQQSLDAKTAVEMDEKQRGFRDDTGEVIGVTRFRQLDVMRLAYRNREFAPQFRFDGIQNWQQDVSGLACKTAATLRTPEGEVSLVVSMMRQITENGRPTWRIVAPAQGMVVAGKVTRYGQKMMDLEIAGRALVNQSFLLACNSLTLRTKLAYEYAKPQPNPTHGIELLRQDLARAGTLGSLAAIPQAAPGYETLMKSQFFVPLDRGDTAKEGDAREKFYSVWQEGRLTPPGFILTDSPDQAPLISVTEKSVEMRVPIEMQLPRMEATQSAARGAVVVVCDDPEFIAKLNELRKAAATDPLVDPVQQSKAPEVPWTIRRIESDMKHVTMPKPAAGPGGGPPGM